MKLVEDRNRCDEAQSHPTWSDPGFTGGHTGGYRALSHNQICTGRFPYQPHTPLRQKCIHWAVKQSLQTGALLNLHFEDLEIKKRRPFLSKRSMECRPNLKTVSRSMRRIRQRKTFNISDLEGTERSTLTRCPCICELSFSFTLFF